MSVSPTQPLCAYLPDHETGERYAMTFSLEEFREVCLARAHGPLDGLLGLQFADMTGWLVYTRELGMIDPDTYACVLDLHLEEIMLDILARDDFYDEPGVRTYTSSTPSCKGHCSTTNHRAHV